MSSKKISVQAAERLIRDSVKLTPAVPCPLAKAAGRILREDIVADRELPPFDRCMMDGYAVRASEAKYGAVFRVAGRLHAGEPVMDFPKEPLVVVEVMTGSVLPQGADVVIPYEDTESAGEGSIRLTDSEPIAAWDFVHRRGSDYAQGAILLAAGVQLGPVDVGIAASCGYAEPLVSQLPRIAVFSTGDELVNVDVTPLPHQIRQSNATAIENALASAGFPVGLLDSLSDDETIGRAKLEQALANSDVVIISGAVSRGKKDWVAPALDALSEQQFHGVAQRPGKPMGFWTAESGARIFGLPGNPISTLVATHRYVLPYLQLVVGSSWETAESKVLGSPFEFSAPLTLFLPVAINCDGRALPQPANNSGDYARLAGTSGFIELPAAEFSWQAGGSFPYTPWQR